MRDKTLKADIKGMMSLVFKDIYHDEDYCLVCGYHEYEDGDEIIYCDYCGISFHLSCYGLEEDDIDKDFECNNCKAFGSNSMIIKCALCLQHGGAMKPSQP